MRNLIALIIMICSVSASTVTAEATFAKGIFKPTSLVPRELQARILEAIVNRCSPAVNRSTLVEESTLIHERYVDEDTLDSYFTTKMAAYADFNDGNGPSRKIIIVESVEYDLSNPAIDQFEIIRVTGESGICR